MAGANRRQIIHVIIGQFNLRFDFRTVRRLELHDHDEVQEAHRVGVQLGGKVMRTHPQLAPFLPAEGAMACGCEHQHPRRLLIKSRANDRRGSRGLWSRSLRNLLDCGANAMQRTPCVKFSISDFGSCVLLAKSQFPCPLPGPSHRQEKFPLCVQGCPSPRIAPLSQAGVGFGL